MTKSHLLLIDLDGVLVLEVGAPRLPRREILRLHQHLEHVLNVSDAFMVVLTHRSRAEATRILAAVQLRPVKLDGVVSAEDLFQAGLRHGGVRGLARWGLRKSWSLPVVEKRFGIPRERIAIIDDRPENLRDLLDHGVGLAMLAPSAFHDSDGCLTTFRIEEAVGVFSAWREGAVTSQPFQLTPYCQPLAAWQHTGMHTRRQGRHLFNFARRVGRLGRRPFRWTSALASRATSITAADK